MGRLFLLLYAPYIIPVALLVSIVVLHAIYLYIRLWMHYGERPSYELVKEREIRDEYRNEFSRLDYVKMYCGL